MNKLLLAATIICFTGCVGLTTPHNPMVDTTPLTPAQNFWWSGSVVGIDEAKSPDNPWNAQVPVPPPVKDWTDPWADFEEPKLFPERFKPASPSYLNKKRIKLLELEKSLRIKKIRKAILELNKQKRKERMFKRSI